MTPQTLAGMLDAADGNGSCVAWANLLAASLTVHGFGTFGAYPRVRIVEVKANKDINPGATGFLVKNWMFGQDGILTGPDGINNSDAQGDDQVIIPKGRGLPHTLCVLSGPDNFPDSVPGGDDDLDGLIESHPPVFWITTGANGVCETAVGGDDEQLIPLGQGMPNTMGIIAGPNATVDTVPAPDDVAGSGAPGSGWFPYETNVSVVNLPGIAGQDNPEPPPAFENHYIVRVRWSATLRDFTLYDPSYGGIGYSKENDHENAAIDGIMGPWVPAGNNHSARVNNTTTQELSYTDR